MTIHTDHNDIIFECDDCNELLYTETSNFDSALNIMHRNNWKAKVAKGQSEASKIWKHICANCKNG